MEMIETQTQVAQNKCITFREADSTTKDYLRIYSEDGCWSNIGKQGGRQGLSLEKPKCVNSHTAAHELIHALG